MRRFTVFATLCAMGACGGSSRGSSGGSVTGAIRGHAYSIEDAVSTVTPWSAGGLDGEQAVIVLSSSAKLCGELMANTQHPGQQFVTIIVGTISGGSVSAPTSGTYAIGATSGNSAQWDAYANTATCDVDMATSAFAVSGTVAVTSASSGVIAGHFDVVLDSGDHVTGSFDPEACAATTNAGGGVCM